MALLNRFRILCLSVACLLAPLTAATAQDTARQLRIGVMAPGDGPYDLLGLQMQTALQAFGAIIPLPSSRLWRPARMVAAKTPPFPWSKPASTS
jgi:hypothetical protein